jgi:hypothetical protein
MRIAAVCLFILALATGPVLAKGGPPKPAAAGPKAGSVQAPKGAAARGPATPKTQGGGPRTPGGQAKAAPMPAPPGPPKGAQAAKPGKGATTRQGSATAERGGNAVSSTGSGRATSDTGASASSSTTAGSETGLQPAAGPNVPRNPKLQAKLQAMLPSGMGLQDAAAGFKNQGQFVAALHVSNNLGVPFGDLKGRMVDDGLSLGQAIQAVKPGLDGTREATRGEQQAAADLRR